MSRPVEYLDLEDLIDLARNLLGDPPPIRDVGLLGSAAARPQATAFGQDAYPDVLAKAAALLQSIVKNHALVDRNERLGWLATAVFLELNGIKASKISDEQVYELVVWAASSSASLDDITTRLAALVPQRRRR
jgi:death-on-curing protein